MSSVRRGQSSVQGTKKGARTAVTERLRSCAVAAWGASPTLDTYQRNRRRAAQDRYSQHHQHADNCQEEVHYDADAPWAALLHHSTCWHDVQTRGVSSGRSSAGCCCVSGARAHSQAQLLLYSPLLMYTMPAAFVRLEAEEGCQPRRRQREVSLLFESSALLSHALSLPPGPYATPLNVD